MVYYVVYDVVYAVAYDVVHDMIYNVGIFNRAGWRDRATANQTTKLRISTPKCFVSTLRKNAIESIAFLSKSMYITDSNQYAIELVTYLLVLEVYFYELIVYMLLERNAFDSIAFFSQWELLRSKPNRKLRRKLV